MGGSSIRKCATGDCGNRGDEKMKRKNAKKIKTIEQTIMIKPRDEDHDRALSDNDGSFMDMRDGTMLAHEPTFKELGGVPNFSK